MSAERPFTPTMPVGKRNDLLLTARDLLLFVPLIALIAFWKLETPSFHPGDESVHVRVTQEMLQGGSWWQPHSFDRYYFNKPPLKMWLSVPVVAMLGESNFGYRFLDALCGVMTGILLYFFARKLFASRAGGVFAAYILFGCKAYLFFHGIRSANQDSVMVFLVTLAIVIGWQLLQSTRSFTNAAFGGVAIGCAVLTKNVIGFLPLFVLGSYLLLRGELFLFLRQRWLEALIVLLLATGLPALYLVPKCAADHSVCMIMINQEVIDRVTVGYHNTAEFWYYFRRLFQARMTIAPEIFAVSLVYGVYQAVVQRAAVHVFLLCWFAVPFLILSAIPSRNEWYLSPILPGGALLGAGTLTAALTYFRENFAQWWDGRERFRPALGIVTLLLCAAAYGMAWQYKLVLRKVIFPRYERITMDYFGERVPREGLLVSLGDFFLAKNERIYRDMYREQHTAGSVEEARALIKRGEVGYLLAPIARLEEALRVARFTGYAIFPPVYKRGRLLLMLSYTAEPPTWFFRPVKQLLRLGEQTANLLYGWGEAQPLHDRSVRFMEENSAALTVEGDEVFRALGAEVKVNFAPSHPDGNTVLKIALNGTTLGSIGFSTNELATYSFVAPRELWRSGRNVLSFDVRGGENQRVLFNWIAVALPVAQAGSAEPQEHR